jgi:hypothetical protein
VTIVEQVMLFSESRYDFLRCLWSDIWDEIKAAAKPKCLGANHPKYRTPVEFRGYSPAYRFSEKNMTA